MKINKKFKSKVFKAAWTSIKKGKAANLSEALKSAWAWAKRTLLDKGVSGFKIIRETAKAICIAGQAECVHTNQVRRANFWVPKSLLNNGVIPTWFFNKKVNEVLESFNYSATLEFRLI